MVKAFLFHFEIKKNESVYKEFQFDPFNSKFKKRRKAIKYFVIIFKVKVLGSLQLTGDAKYFVLRSISLSI